MDYAQYASLFTPQPSAPVVPTAPDTAERLLGSKQQSSGAGGVQEAQKLAEYFRKSATSAPTAGPHTWTPQEQRAFGVPESERTGPGGLFDAANPATSWMQENAAQTIASGEGLAADAAAEAATTGAAAAEEGVAAAEGIYEGLAGLLGGLL